MPPQLRQDYEHIIMLCAGTGITPMLQLSRCHINQQRQLVSTTMICYHTVSIMSSTHEYVAEKKCISDVALLCNCNRR
jgi:ferredoxin-NADP reductase